MFVVFTFGYLLGGIGRFDVVQAFINLVIISGVYILVRYSRHLLVKYLIYAAFTYQMVLIYLVYQGIFDKNAARFQWSVLVTWVAIMVMPIHQYSSALLIVAPVFLISVYFQAKTEASRQNELL